MVQETGFPISYETTVIITSQDIDDIVCTALEGGITYWCCKAKVVGEYLGEYASDQISRGGKLILYDAESDDKWTLTRGNFLNGLRLWLMNGMDVDHGVYEGKLDTGAIDASSADCIIQYALFGKIVFG